MKKVLYISNIAGSKASTNFFGTAMNAAKHQGFDFYVVANRSKSNINQISEDEKEYGIHLLHADISRSPFSLSNMKAYKQIKTYISKFGIDYIHCNTPVGGLLGRLAGAKCGVKKIIYQVHGFHFYKGAPIINWLLYYPIERILAHYTDVLITINHEDYKIAKKFHLRNKGNVYYVPGVGIDINNIKRDEEKRRRVRAELKIPDDVFLIISVGEINKNKNNKIVLKAISNLNSDKIHYIICGEGPLKESLKAEYASDNIHFLGYRNDISDLLCASDIFVLSSFREGLSRSIMEAMCAELPCVVSNIRGNTDLIRNEEMHCDPRKCSDFEKAIKSLIDSKDFYMNVSETNHRVIKEYSVDTVTSELISIYENELKY